MAALSAPLDNQEKQGHVCTYALGAAKRVYKGGLVVVDNTTGLLEAASDSANKTYVGVACESGDNSTGAAGAVPVRVQKQGSFVFAATGAASAWIGQPIYTVDDQTVALAVTTTNDIEVGRVVEAISATRVRIRIDNSVR